MTTKPPAAFQANQPAKTMHEFGAELETAINHATKFRPYRKTAIVAFHWANDDIGVKPLEDELLAVFRSVYNFEVSSFTIPVQQPQISLLEHLLSWSKKNSGENTLRIFVYSGHADYAGTVSLGWNLGGRCNPNNGNLLGPKLNWWAIRSNLEEYSGEVCYIFDTCSAAAGALSSYDGGEFMAASVYGQSASANIHFSFTRTLIDELRDLNGQPETLADIYARIFRYAQQNQVGSAPVHIPKPSTPSVTIGRISTRVATRSIEQDACHVLLSVKVKDTMPLDLTEWKNWLTRNIPANVLSAKVAFQGAFKGSSLLLFTVPVEVWTMMSARDPSYGFIGHVTSHNILSLPLSQRTVRVPPPSGRENEPPRDPGGKSGFSPGTAPPR